MVRFVRLDSFGCVPIAGRHVDFAEKISCANFSPAEYIFRKTGRWLPLMRPIQRRSSSSFLFIYLFLREVRN